MWDVVVWTDERAIDFVPSIWANADHTKYKYPTSLSEHKVREIIYECKDLVQNFTWCEVELKKKCIKSLQLAKSYCEKGQYTSNIETEDETSDLQIRRKPKRLIEECGEDTTRKNQSQVLDDEQEESEDDIPIVRKTFNVPKQNRNHNIQSKSSNTYNNTSSTSQPQSRCSTPMNSSSNNMQIDLLRTIIKNQADIKFEIKELQRRMDVMDNRHLTVTAHTVPTTNHSVFLEMLPLQTIEKINEIEQLIESEDLFNELVHILYLVGGETLSRTVNVTMKKLLHNNVAILYSGVGKKHKLPFCDLKLYKAVQAAIRKRCPTSTEQEIKKNVSLYLAQAKSRQQAKESVTDPIPQ